MIRHIFYHVKPRPGAVRPAEDPLLHSLHSRNAQCEALSHQFPRDIFSACLAETLTITASNRNYEQNALDNAHVQQYNTQE